jgi:hypothetical protein
MNGAPDQQSIPNNDRDRLFPIYLAETMLAEAQGPGDKAHAIAELTADLPNVHSDIKPSVFDVISRAVFRPQSDPYRLGGISCLLLGLWTLDEQACNERCDQLILELHSLRLPIEKVQREQEELRVRNQTEFKKKFGIPDSEELPLMMSVSYELLDASNKAYMRRGKAEKIWATAHGMIAKGLIVSKIKSGSEEKMSAHYKALSDSTLSNEFDMEVDERVGFVLTGLGLFSDPYPAFSYFSQYTKKENGYGGEEVEHRRDLICTLITGIQHLNEDQQKTETAALEAEAKSLDAAEAATLETDAESLDDILIFDSAVEAFEDSKKNPNRYQERLKKLEENGKILPIAKSEEEALSTLKWIRDIMQKPAQTVLRSQEKKRAPRMPSNCITM